MKSSKRPQGPGDKKPKKAKVNKLFAKTKKTKPAAKAEIPATIVKPCDPPPKTVPVLIRTKFYGNTTETQQIMRIPLVENDTIRLDMTIDLRKSEFIEIRAIRREFGDVAGLIADAEGLANAATKPS